MSDAPTSSIQEAGRWLASVPRSERPSPIVPALQRRFDLTPAEACAAIRVACGPGEGAR